MSTIIGPPPEQGQLVSVRSRNWVVADAAPGTVPADLLKSGLEAPQHLLTLSSIEDDGLGEELRVIWELEPGARLVEKVALPEPTGFDPPEHLDAFLDALRWGASSTAGFREIASVFLDPWQAKAGGASRIPPSQPCSPPRRRQRRTDGSPPLKSSGPGRKPRSRHSAGRNRPCSKSWSRHPCGSGS